MRNTVGLWWVLQVRINGRWYTLPKSNERSRAEARNALIRRGETMWDYPDYRIIRVALKAEGGGK